MPRETERMFFHSLGYSHWASLIAQMVKSLPAMQETRAQSLSRKIPWRREWQPALVFLPRESHGLRILAGYSPIESQRIGTQLSS